MIASGLTRLILGQRRVTGFGANPPLPCVTTKGRQAPQSRDSNRDTTQRPASRGDDDTRVQHGFRGAVAGAAMSYATFMGLRFRQSGRGLLDQRMWPAQLVGHLYAIFGRLFGGGTGIDNRIDAGGGVTGP